MLAEKNPQVKKAIGKLVELNEDERKRMIADSQEKLRRDIASIKRFAVKEGLERGLEKGREEGREEGLEKGRKEERLAMVRNLLKLGLSVDKIMSVTSLSEEEIQSLIV